MNADEFTETGRLDAQPEEEIQIPESNSSRNQSARQAKKETLAKEARRALALMMEAVDNDRETDPSKESGLVYSKNPLKAFIASETITVEKFRNSGGLRSIVIIIQKHRTCSDIIHHSCSALAAFSLYERSTVRELVKVGAIESVVAAVGAQAEGGTDDACVSALKVLRNLTQNEENRAQIYKSSGLEAVCKTMEHHSGSGRTLSHAALVLSNLTFGNTEMKEAVGMLGGLEAIAKGMKEHKDYQAMQARGSLALRNMCFQCDYNQGLAGEVGVVEALINAINWYMDDREVAHQCCIALANLSNVSERNRQKIVQAGGANILVKLMQAYPDSNSANDDAIAIIRNIAVGNAEAQMEIGVSGGIGCLCRAIEKFTKHERIPDKACTAIRYLCFLPENRVKVHDSGGIEAIIAAMKANIDRVGTVENALLAIGNATFESVENKSTVGRCGGITAIIEAVERHRLSERIQEHGCRVLRNLSDGFEPNRKLEAENGVINIGVFAMMGYPDNASVQEQACAMLLNISLSEIFLERLRKADVERLGEKALSSHPKHRGVQLQAGMLVDRMNGFDIEIGGIEQEGNASGSRRGLISRLLPNTPRGRNART